MRFLSVVKVFLCFIAKLRPVWLKKRCLSVVQHGNYLFSRFYSLVFQICLSVYIVKGVEKQSHEMMSVLFVGNERFPFFFFNRVFEKDMVVEEKGRVYLWNISKLKRRYGMVDSVVVSCDRFYQRFLHRAGFYVFPHLVNMVYDSSKNFDQLMKKLSHSAQEDVRKVKKTGFSFEISRDIEKIQRFYYKMYRPMIETRVGTENAFQTDVLFLQFFYQAEYELLLISYHGQEVSGCFFHHTDDTMFLKYAGVHQGDVSLIKKGAFSAIYYFVIVHAKDLKVTTVDFGGVRPFFNDGLFQYKRKWGMTVGPHDIVKKVFGLQIVRKSGPSKQFLMHNPFIGINEKNELIGYVFVDKDLSNGEKNEYEERFHLPGLQEFRFIVL